MSKPKLLVSFSGGRSSAMMCYLIMLRYAATHEIIIVFANTSREEEETLIFVQKCAEHFKINVVWVEAVVHFGRRKSCTHKIVDFNTAKRDGSVFEAVIKKYGIPNKKFPHCTRELKRNPIRSYATSLGWKHYTTAIGYRADEPKRINWEKAKKNRQIYPLAELGIKKADVALFWQQQSFDLELKDYQGNCKLCYKKNKRKLLTKISEDIESTEWVKEMEVKYEQTKPGKRARHKEPCRFFRENDSIDDLIEESKLPFDPAVDKSKITDGADLSSFNAEMDFEEECAESCEPF